MWTYMTVMFMCAEKIKQGHQTFFIAKHNRRKVTVKELNPISNGWRPGWPGKRCIERLEIKFKDITSIAPRKSFFITHTSIFLVLNTEEKKYVYEIICPHKTELEDKQWPYCPSTSSSLNWRYSATLKWSTLSS